LPGTYDTKGKFFENDAPSSAWLDDEKMPLPSPSKPSGSDDPLNSPIIPDFIEKPIEKADQVYRDTVEAIVDVPMDVAKDVVDKVKDVYDEKVGKPLKIMKWVMIIGGAVVVIGGIALVFYLITHRKELVQEARENRTMMMQDIQQSMNQSEKMQKFYIDQQLMPLKMTADLVETHPETVKVAGRVSSGIATGGASEAIQGLDLKSIINNNKKEIKDDIKEIKDEVKEDVEDVKEEVEEVVDEVKEA
jgi:hypothetical protein